MWDLPSVTGQGLVVQRHVITSFKKVVCVFLMADSLSFEVTFGAYLGGSYDFLCGRNDAGQYEFKSTRKTRITCRQQKLFCITFDLLLWQFHNKE